MSARKRFRLFLSILALSSVITVSKFLFLTMIEINDIQKVVDIENNFDAGGNSGRFLFISNSLFNGTAKCPKTTRPTDEEILYRHDVWQYIVNNKSNDAGLVYSAYYDDRPPLRGEVWLRIIGLTASPAIPLDEFDEYGVAKDPSILKTLEQTRTYYCQVWYNGLSAPYIAPVVLDLGGRAVGYTFGDVTYFQELMSCKLPPSINDPTPTHVSLVRSPCDQSTTLVPVTVNQRQTDERRKHLLGVCVPIAFGSVDNYELVEWFEFHKLLGITEINIYDSGMKNSTSVLNHYTSSGLLKIHPIPIPVKYRKDESIPAVKLSSVIALNDCMMRNYENYQLLLVVDFDEIIIPKKQNNYIEMLEHLDNVYKLKEAWTRRRDRYSFFNIYFFLENAPDSSQPSYLRSMRFRQKSTYEIEVLPKSMINPRSCLSLFNHYCYHTLNKAYHSYVDVNETVASIHHFRLCNNREASICKQMVGNKTIDNTALRFKSKIDYRVKIVLNELFSGRTV